MIIDIFVSILLTLNKILFNNLGLTIIVIGSVSRLIFTPFLRSSMSYNQKVKELQPKLKEIRNKYKNNPSQRQKEEMRLYQEAGINPIMGCLPLLVQVGLAILLYQALRHVLAAGISTHFLLWDLAAPNSFRIETIPFALPGVLAILTAIATLVQSRMMLPEPPKILKEDSSKEKNEKEGFMDALNASQGQMVYLLPLFYLFWGVTLPAGIILFWLTNTVFGIVQQYYFNGLGGLKSWLTWIK